MEDSYDKGFWQKSEFFGEAREGANFPRFLQTAYDCGLM